MRRPVDQGDDTYVSPVVKYLLFFFNFVFWIVGVALIVIGAWAFTTKQLEDTKKISSVSDFIFDVAIIVVIIGVCVFILASEGCLGALRENVCLLRFFYISLVVIFVALLVLGILGFSLSAHLLTLLRTKLSGELTKKYMDDPDLRDIVDWVQGQFECCGLSSDGYTDWQNNDYYSCTKDNPSSNLRCGVPYSCCRPEIKKPPGFPLNTNCGYQMQTKAAPVAGQSIYTRGCADAVIETLKGKIFVVSGVILGLSLIPLLGVFLGVTLVGQVQDQKDRWLLTESRRLHYIHQ